MARKKEDRSNKVVWNGRIYYPRLDLSKQNDYRSLFRKMWRLDLDAAVNARINKTQLQNVTYMYPRLYQLPEQAQKRLRAWIDKNQNTIQGWELGDFLKTAVADRLEGTNPRKPGFPDEVMRACEKDLGNGNTKNFSSLTSQALERRPTATQLPLTRYVHFAQGPQTNQTGYNLIQNEDRDQQRVGTKHPQDGTFIVNPDGSAITQGYQDNQTDYPEHPLLGPHDGPPGALDKSLAIASPNSYRMRNGEYLVGYPEEHHYGRREECSRGVPASYANEQQKDHVEQHNDESLADHPDEEHHNHAEGYHDELPAGHANEQKNDHVQEYNDEPDAGYYADLELHNRIQEWNNSLLADGVEDQYSHIQTFEEFEEFEKWNGR